MLPLLAANWGLLLLRGGIAVLFGLIALHSPRLTLTALVFLFGAYALADGVVALIVAFRARRLQGFGSLLFDGMVRIGAGLIACAYPGISAIAPLELIAAWVVLSGIAEIATAIALRREMTGEWPLPVAGALSVVFGVLLIVRPDAGVLPLVWQIGLYATIFGTILLALALRLQELAQEMGRA